jgi:hypothetical protein
VFFSGVLPADMSRVGLKDDTWTFTFNDPKGLCSVLHKSIIKVNTSIATQKKGDKMSMLYNFLASNVDYK